MLGLAVFVTLAFYQSGAGKPRAAAPLRRLRDIADFATVPTYMALSVGRVSGSALRALAVLVRSPAMQRVLAAVVTKELGIDAIRALGQKVRGPVPFGLEPRQARPNHARASANLPRPKSSSHPRSATALAEAYCSGESDPERVVARALAHAESFGARSPLCARDDERSRRDAAASAERYRRGAPLGELDGVPIVVKEEMDAAGYPTRLGTSFMPSTPAARDSTFVARLRGAGAIVIGQTPMTEYGLSPLGANPHRRMPENAQVPGHLAGGSSTGSAVAVALGLAPLGLGTDGGGSIRVPASHNGVFGIKPSFGRIPCAGHGAYGGTSVVHFGLIGVSTSDLALALESSSGADGCDRPSLAAPPFTSGELAGALGRGVRGLTLGVPEAEWGSATSSVAAAGRAALRALEADGATLVPLELPLARHAAAIGYVTIAIEATAALREVEALVRPALGADLRVFLAGVNAFSATDYVHAQRLREALREDVANALARVDLIVLPTTADVAATITPAEARSGIIDTHALDAACRFVFLGNLLGLPACSVPVGRDSRGLPIGLQLVGDAWDEACVLGAAAHLERLEIARPLPAPGGLDLLG
jgi:aspartyl-tRNA(Asn)/glutamyl-tRNA(Gln) amidotransferase subunit A